MIQLFNKIKNWALVAVTAALLVSVFLLKNTITEKNRLGGNQTALMEEITFYKTSDSLNAAGVQRLVLEKTEFRKYNEELNKTIESLNLKLKRIQSVSETSIKTEYKIKTEIKDSIVFRDRLPEDTLKCLKYADPWISLSGCFHITDTDFVPVIETRDTIDQVIHRVPRKFLFFRYGTKAIRQEIVVKNPYSKPVFTEFIEFKK